MDIELEMHEMWSSTVAGYQFRAFLQQVQMLLDSIISRWLTTSWATQLSCSLTTGRLTVVHRS